GDQIDLAVAGARVAREHTEAELIEMRGGELLAQAPERAAWILPARGPVAMRVCPRPSGGVHAARRYARPAMKRATGAWPVRGSPASTATTRAYESPGAHRSSSRPGSTEATPSGPRVRGRHERPGPSSPRRTRDAAALG